MRILLVEDDETLADALVRALRMASHSIDWAQDGEAADRALNARVHDLVVLDVRLPKITGWEVLRRLRARKDTVPVLMLTVRDTLDDRVRGLDLGADDYLTKPFDLPELEARLRALYRRSHGAAPEIQHGPLSFDNTARRAYINGEPIDLSAREIGVLEMLLLRIGHVISKDQINHHLCDWEQDLGPNAIEVYVHRLRRKLEPTGIIIRTVRGLGYLLEKPHLA
jgi:two-component system, OmpR family, response regulator